MFTGIVEEIGRIERAEVHPELARFTVACEKALDGSAVGSSIAVNGVCVTAVQISDTDFAFEAVPETLRRSNLGELKVGDGVNLERPMSVGSRFGGHIVQGHVDGQAEITSIEADGESRMYGFEVGPAIARFLVEKAYIALDGASLTIAWCEGARFGVALIPHTIANVVMGSKQPGYKANVEVDIVAKYVEKLTADGS
ncbi:MAG: riboflavin synthase [Chloroflexi bacterium]|nr:riboflavin synthase [Chloroflexota bacterium]